jgi:hypothetical protein
LPLEHRSWRLDNKMQFRSSLAGLIILVLGSTAQAGDQGWLGFRNDSNVPIIVQGVSVVNGMPRQGPRYALQPGQECWYVLISQGNKLILVADARQPTIPLLRDTVNYSGTDLFYSIQAASTSPVQKSSPIAKPGQPVAKVVLSTATATTKPPAGGGIGLSTGGSSKKR